MVEFRYRGRQISQEDILYIRALVERHPNESRRTLSTKLCEAWQWRQTNGALRDMVCRGLLLMLERAGQITLPPVSYVRHNPLARRARPEPVQIDTTPIEDRLRNLQPLEFEQVRRTAQRAVVQQPDGGASLPRLRATGGRTLEVPGVGARAAGRLPGVVLGSASPGQSRPLHRLERRSAAPEYPLPRLQHAIPDPAVGTGGTPGVAYSGPNGGADLRGLAADVRSSDLLSGDLRGSGAIPRNLLPRGQLGVAGQDDGTRQAIQQLRAEPVDQRGSGVSADEAVSRTARGR